MCNIAPFCMKCEWEDVKDNLVMCAGNRLHAAARELVRSIPIIGDEIEPYRCQGFMVVIESEKGE